MVLARTATTPVAAPFVAAVFDPNRDAGRDEPLSVAYSELVPSQDGVQRWIYSSYVAADGTRLPTLAARLSEIAGGPGNSPPFLLAPPAPLESMPTYAIADVLSCIKSNPQSAKEAFAGKVVLIGSNLAEEDRKRGPDRFLKWPSSVKKDLVGCGLQALGPSAPDSDSVPGVHIHAAAVNSLLGQTGIAPVPTRAQIVAAMSAAVICASLGLFLSPVVAVGAFVGFLIVLFAASVIGVGLGAWLPVAVPTVAGLAALLGGQLARFFVQDRRRRRIETAFGCYLAPQIVSQLSEEGSDLKLGGEVREITVMFADLSDFTAISDTMQPTELMELTNRYFKVIVGVIDEMGGYVDKFIGDSVMAMWGAPASAQDSAARAVASAFLIDQRVSELNSAASGDSAKFGVKIGISSGPAIVGDVGTPRRLSYTALGSTVNLAERLEKVCSTFGCCIVVNSTTMEALKDRYLFCELDAVRLKGKRNPVPAYEAIASIRTATPEQLAYVAPVQRRTAMLSARRGGHGGVDMDGARRCDHSAQGHFRSGGHGAARKSRRRRIRGFSQLIESKPGAMTCWSLARRLAVATRGDFQSRGARSDLRRRENEVAGFATGKTDRRVFRALLEVEPPRDIENACRKHVGQLSAQQKIPVLGQDVDEVLGEDGMLASTSIHHRAHAAAGKHSP